MEVSSMPASILIVDDTPQNLRLLSQILAQQGYTVRVASSGAQAIQSVQKKAPDLILLDVMMPEMDGYATCARLKADAATRDVPVIFLSALDSVQDKIAAFKAGGVDYITKPFEATEVLVRITTHLELRRMQQQLQAQNQQLAQEVTERRRAEAQLQLLHDLDLAILGMPTPESIALAALARLRQLLSCQRLTVLELAADAPPKILAQETRAGFNTDWMGWEELTTGDAQDLARLHYIPDLETVTPRTVLQARLYASGVRAYLSVPLPFQQQIIGALRLEAEVPNAFSPEHIAMATQIAVVLAIGIHQARLSLNLQQEVSERRRAEAELRESEARYRMLADHANDVIWLLNLQGRFTYVSPSVERLRGYTPEEVLQQDIAQSLTPDSAALARAGLERVHSVLARGERYRAVDRYELAQPHKDGSTVWTEAITSVVYDDAGQPAGILGVSRDIRERKQAEATLHAYTQELEASNAELDAFAHTVAHDLKTPLSVIIGFGSILEKRWTRLSPEQIIDNLQRITHTSYKMRDIINELLLLAGIRKQGDIPLGPLAMGDVVSEAQNRLKEMIKEYNATVVTPEQWPVALGYRAWVEEIWVNYLSNALKYGGRPDQAVPPHVELGWDMARIENPESRIENPAPSGGDSLHHDSMIHDAVFRFWVQDNGPGLTPEEQTRVFTQFTRLHQVRAEGHGLGLSIVQRIVERLGGQVGVESVAGQGCRFYFTLPATHESDADKR